MPTFQVGCAVQALLIPLLLAHAPEGPLQQLKDSDARVRRLAAEALGREKAEAAVPALAELLKDRDGPVRGAAADALVRIGPKAVPALAGGLSYPDAFSRLTAAAALLRMGPAAKEAVPALTKALKDSDVDVRIHAASALGKMGAGARPALPALFEAAQDTSNLGVILRPTLPSSVTEAAIGAALEIDPGCKEKLAAAAVPSLAKALKTRDQAVLQAAGYALGRLGAHARPALPALQAALKEARGFGEGAIASALTAITGDAPQALTDLIRDRKAPLEKRLHALSELGWSRDAGDKTLAVLTEALKDPEPRIRAGAVDAISHFGPKAKSAVPALLEVLGDEELEKAGSEARIGAENVVGSALVRIGSAAVPGLAELLKDETAKPYVRWQAARALGGMRRQAKAALPVLEAAMKDKLLPIAVEAAGAYGRAGGDVEKALPVLREGLKHTSTFVVWNSAAAVERLGPRARGAIPELMPLLGHREGEVRIIAARALSVMGPAARPAVPAMAELLRKGDARERYQVGHALERLGPDSREAVPVLIGQLKNLGNASPDPVLATLGKIGPGASAAVPALVELLKDAKDLLVGDVINTLGQIGPEARAAVPTLTRFLASKEEFTRARAARALGRIGPDANSAAPRLKGLLGDESPMVRVWAAFALARLNIDPRAQVARLLEMWQDEGDEDNFRSVRHDIAEAVEGLGPDAAAARDLLLQALASEKTPLGTHAQVAHALGRLRTEAPAIVPRLIALLDLPAEGYTRTRNRQHAAEALGLLGPAAKAAVPALRRLLDDGDSDVADAAAAALEKIEPPATEVVAPAEAVNPAARKLRLIVRGDALHVNGSKLTLPVARQELLKVLGPPSREAHLVNTLLTWDDYGLFAYQVPPTDQVISVCVALDRDSLPFWPRQVFSGKLALDGVTVTAKSTLDEVNRGRAGRPFEAPQYLPSRWVSRVGDTTLTLLGPHPNLKSEGVNFRELSMEAPVRVRPLAVSGGVEIHLLSTYRSASAVTRPGNDPANLTASLWFPARWQGLPKQSYLLRLVDLAPVEDDTGRLLSSRTRLDRIGALREAVQLNNPFHARGQDGPIFYFNLDAPARQATALKRLKGKAEVSALEIKSPRFDLSEVAGKALDDPALQGMKVVATVQAKGGDTVVRLRVPPQNARLASWAVESQGKQLQTLAGTETPVEGGFDLEATYRGPLPEGCTLRLDMAVPTETRTFEFDFEDVELP